MKQNKPATSMLLLPLLFMAILLLTLPILAATTQQKPKQPTNATQATAPAATAQLSFTEKIAIQALTAQESNKIQELTSIRQQEMSLVTDIEAHHPGFVYNVRSGVLEKAPAPAKPPAAKSH